MTEYYLTHIISLTGIVNVYSYLLSYVKLPTLLPPPGFEPRWPKPGPICRGFTMILKINLAAVFPNENRSTILSKNSAYQT